MPYKVKNRSRTKSNAQAMASVWRKKGKDSFISKGKGVYKWLVWVK